MYEILLIGDPVAHSRSPAMQNAALSALGVPARYSALQTSAADLAARVAALRGPAFLGANVTLPHKQAVLPLLDALEDEAARIGAVNTIYKRSDGALVGANTDAPALIDDLRANLADPAGHTAVLLGASGAARAAAFALLDAGVGALVVANRSLGRAEELLADMLERALDADGLLPDGSPPPPLLALELGDPELNDYIAACGLLINATALGWQPDETPLPDPPVGRQTFVYDMVYRPTRLLHAAAARGARTCAGAGMLVRQGGLALSRWTGHEPPLELMRAAAFPTES